MAEEKKAAAPQAGAQTPEAKKAAKGGRRPTPLKRAIQDQKKRSRNNSCIAEIKTEIIKMQNMKSQNTEDALKKGQMNKIYSIIDKAVKKGVLKKNAAARIKSKASL
jgi:small subunit ribosomal protein S20